MQKSYAILLHLLFTSALVISCLDIFCPILFPDLRRQVVLKTLDQFGDHGIHFFIGEGFLLIRKKKTDGHGLFIRTEFLAFKHIE